MAKPEFIPGGRLPAALLNTVAQQSHDAVNAQGSGDVGFFNTGQGVLVTSSSPETVPRAAIKILCHNVGTAQVEPFNAAVIVGAAYETNDPGIHGQHVLNIRRAGTSVSDETLANVWATESIAAGMAKECWIQGVVLVKLKHHVADYDFGTPEAPLDPTASTVLSASLDVSNSNLVLTGRVDSTYKYPVLWEEPVATPWLTEHYALILAGGGGGGIEPVRLVDVLPAIPTAGMEEVRWKSYDGGTGDDQVWRAYAGDSKWTATQRFTTKSGVP